MRGRGVGRSDVSVGEELCKGVGACEVAGSVPGKGPTYGFQELKTSSLAG